MALELSQHDPEVNAAAQLRLETRLAVLRPRLAKLGLLGIVQLKWWISHVMSSDEYCHVFSKSFENMQQWKRAELSIAKAR